MPPGSSASGPSTAAGTLGKASAFFRMTLKRCLHKGHLFSWLDHRSMHGKQYLQEHYGELDPVFLEPLKCLQAPTAAMAVSARAVQHSDCNSKR